MKRILALALVSILSTSCFGQQHPGAEEFAARAAEEYQLNPEEVVLLLEDARFKQFTSKDCICFSTRCQ